MKYKPDDVVMHTGFPHTLLLILDYSDDMQRYLVDAEQPGGKWISSWLQIDYIENDGLFRKTGPNMTKIAKTAQKKYRLCEIIEK